MWVLLHFGFEDCLPYVASLMSKVLKLFEIILQSIAVYSSLVYGIFSYKGKDKMQILCFFSVSAVSCTLGSVGLLQISLEMVVVPWNLIALAARMENMNC